MRPRRARRPPHVERLEGRLLMAAGDADVKFGTNGLATFTIPGTGQAGYNVNDAVLQPDGKVVLLLSDVATARPTLARVTAAGALDRTFGRGGLATDLGVEDAGIALGLQSDGKLIVAGTDHANESAVVAERFLPDGTPDTTFGGGGTGAAAFSDPQASFSAGSLVVRPDDRIVLGGEAAPPGQLATDGVGDFALFALTADGRVDTSFGGGDGIATADFGGAAAPSTDVVESLALLDDGRIVASGHSVPPAPSENDLQAVALFDADGSLDPAFDGDGRLTLPSPGVATHNSVVTVPGGDKIALLLNFAPNQFGVARLNADGSFDPTFGGGGDGIAPITAPVAFQDGAVGADAAGRIVVALDVADDAGNRTGVRLFRLNTDGTTDTTFNGAAFATAVPQSDTRRVLIGPDGGITVAGQSPGFRELVDSVVVARATAAAGPTAALGGPPAATAGAATFAVTVTYTAAAGRAVDRSTIGPTDVRVTGPNSYSQPAATVGAVTAAGNVLTVTYNFPAPGGSLGPADGGAYTLAVEPGEVTDTTGEPSSAGTAGTFALAVAGAQLPDLAFADTTFSAGTYQAGDTIPAHLVATATGGTSVGPFQVDVVLSVDQTYGNADDFPLTTVAAATSGTPITSVGPVPAGILPGSYFLIARLDAPDTVAESNETNNTFFSATAAITVATPTPTAPSRTIGGLDPAFGTGGVIRPRLGFIGSAGVRRVPDGRIVIAGFGGPVGSRDIGLARLNADTTRDTTFGAADGTADGVAFADVRGTNDRVVDFDVLPDGRILVAGTSADGPAGIDAGTDWFVARFNTDGALDPTFGGGGGAKPGITLIDFAANPANHTVDLARDLLVLADGRIVVVGRTDGGGAGGGAGTDFAIARLTASGAPDGSFGNGGRNVVDFGFGDDAAQSVVATADGGLVAAGFATQSDDRRHIALAKFTPAGALDPKFGTGGKVVTLAGGTRDRANAVTIGLKGQIVIAGVTATGNADAGTYASDMVVARYSSRGKPDTKFGVRGVARASFGQPTAATLVSVLPDGRITASGVASTDVARGQAKRFDLAVARFTARGGPDPSFGGDGTVTFSTAPTTGAAANLAPSSERPAATLQPASTLQPAVDSPGEATTPDQDVDEFENSSEGKLTNEQGGGALIAGTSDDATLVATVVTSGVDLSGSFVSAVPASVLGGAKGAATISVANLGDVPAVGSMEIRFFASTDQALSSGDRQFFALPNQKVSLKPLALGGKPKSFKARFAFPADLPDGNFFVLAQVNATSTVAELDPNNDTAFSSRAVAIAAPFVDLTGPPLPGGGTFVAGGKPTTLSVTLTNAGNIPLKATTALAPVLSTDNTPDAGDTTFSPVPVKLSLKANSSKASKIKVLVPAGLVPPGSYFLFIRIDPGNAVPEKDESNNLLTSNLPSAVS